MHFNSIIAVCGYYFVEQKSRNIKRARGCKEEDSFHVKDVWFYVVGVWIATIEKKKKKSRRKCYLTALSRFSVFYGVDIFMIRFTLDKAMRLWIKENTWEVTTGGLWSISGGSRSPVLRGGEEDTEDGTVSCYWAIAPVKRGQYSKDHSRRWGDGT